MRKVSGFLADDGTFFDTKEDADLYDAIGALRFCVTQIGANPDKVMIVVDGAAEQIRRYLDAKENYTKRETDDHAGVRGGREDGSKSAGTIYGRNQYDEAVNEPSYAITAEVAEAINGRGYDPATAPGLTAAERCAATPIPSVIDPTDELRAKAYPVSVLEQPPNRDEYVSDLGSGKLTEAIRERLQVDGVGSRGSDAPSVRSDPVLAINEKAEDARARRRSRNENIRSEKMGEIE